MTPKLITKESEQVGGFLIKLFRIGDIIPSIKRKGPISGTYKFINTVIGVCFLLSFQFCPFFGLHFISRPTHLNLLFASTTNPTELARSSVITSPLIFNLVRSLFKLRGFDTEKKSLLRGARNWTIFIGAVVRAPYVLVMYQLGAEAVLLYPPSYISFILFMYIFQNLLFSIVVVWVEEFLEQYGISGFNGIFYYQLIELFIQIKVNPTPGDFTYVNLFYMFTIVLFVYLQDYIFTEEVEVSHVSNLNNSKKMKYSPSMYISTITMVHTIAKSSMENFVALIYHPGLDLINYYFGVNVDGLKIPLWISNNIFFKEDYFYFYYVSLKDPLIHSIVMALALDLLLFYFISTKIELLDPQFDSNYVNMELKQRNNMVVPTIGSKDPLKDKLRKLKINSTIIGILSYAMISLVPIYGVIIKGPHLVYYYSRIIQLPELIKNEDEVPSYLQNLKSKL